ncbi:hypothetical protein BDF20DRAFT_801658, partial [Mycotypha africana]|uniref:uncharacterized protein n=1 Tax=Mycotypha africana TaxID=64632 RepID=UPI00230130EE
MGTFFIKMDKTNISKFHVKNVYDPLKDLTQIDYPNVVPDKMTSQPKVKVPDSDRSYKNYHDFSKETFIDRMLENLQDCGLLAK